jgi:hypothetical protein
MGWKDLGFLGAVWWCCVLMLLVCEEVLVFISLEIPAIVCAGSSITRSVLHRVRMLRRAGATSQAWVKHDALLIYSQDGKFPSERVDHIQHRQIVSPLDYARAAVTF